eukprot:scaffold85916_cov30-Tisochrysis_lutea.AAC.2
MIVDSPPGGELEMGGGGRHESPPHVHQVLNLVGTYHFYGSACTHACIRRAERPARALELEAGQRPPTRALMLGLTPPFHPLPRSHPCPRLRSAAPTPTNRRR